MCIFFMMSVHVNPALDWGNVPGSWGVVGVFWTDVLGRASVGTLSLISGYLLVGSVSGKGPRAFVADRFKTIFVPMVTWSAIFIAGVVLANSLASAETSALSRLTGIRPIEFVAERVLNLYGTPAVEALAFLRELFVASLILACTLGVVARYPTIVISTLIALSVFGDLAPVMYRPSVLLFMAMGVVLRQQAASLSVPASWRVPMLIALAVAVAVRMGGPNGMLDLAGASARAEDLVLRAVLTLAILYVAGILVRSSAAGWLGQWEPHVFLAYLSHTSVISALWLLWKASGGGSELPSYGAFFLLAPLAALAAARLAAPFVDMLPGAVQVAIRGKAAQSRGSRASTPGPAAEASLSRWPPSSNA
jgi:hypothetical protein